MKLSNGYPWKRKRKPDGTKAEWNKQRAYPEAASRVASAIPAPPVAVRSAS